MCYVKQMVTVDRDQTASQNAQVYFQTIAQQYPDSPFAELAREQLARCRENLAAHELYIAHFYATRGNDKAAEIRWLDVASQYGETPASLASLLQLAKLYQRRDDTPHAELAYLALTQLHPRAPQSTQARRALDRIAKNDPPPSGDPIDLLLAANGRQRSSGTIETVQVPGLEPARGAHAPAALPALIPPTDPFGRGPSGGFPY